MSTLTLRETGSTSDGWEFAVQVADGRRRHDFVVTLRADDRDRWATPDTPPERVVQAAFTFLLGKEPVTSILSRFDCSVIRRYFPEVDQELPALV